MARLYQKTLWQYLLAIFLAKQFSKLVARRDTRRVYDLSWHIIFQFFIFYSRNVSTCRNIYTNENPP